MVPQCCLQSSATTLIARVEMNSFELNNTVLVLHAICILLPIVDNHSFNTMARRSPSRRRREYLEAHWEETTPSMAASSHPELHFEQQQRKVRRKRTRRRHRQQQQQLETEETSKRKRVIQPVGVTASISQVSIVPPSSKRPRPTTTGVEIKTEPDYLKVPDYTFKKMLSTALEGGETVVQSLDTPDKLHYARVYAQLVNDICFLKLKQDYYEQYYQVVCNERVRSSALAKEVIKKNHLHRIEFITQDNMERRRQKIIESIKRAEEALEQHQQSTMLHLSAVILAFVRKGQHKLSAEFKRKILLLQYDVNDVQLVQAFYELKPTDTQVLH
jgi:hypothetical protein